MKDTKRTIDRFFLEELGNAREELPVSIWEQLDKRLEEHAAQSSKSNKAIWLLVAFLLSIAGLSYFLLGHKMNTTSNAFSSGHYAPESIEGKVVHKETNELNADIRSYSTSSMPKIKEKSAQYNTSKYNRSSVNKLNSIDTFQSSLSIEKLAFAQSAPLNNERQVKPSLAKPAKAQEYPTNNLGATQAQQNQQTIEIDKAPKEQYLLHQLVLPAQLPVNMHSKLSLANQINKPILFDQNMPIPNEGSRVTLIGNKLNPSPNHLNNPMDTVAKAKSDTVAHMIKRMKFPMSYGVKLGYERGVQNYTAGKYVATLYAALQLNQRNQIVFQPSLKIAHTNKHYQVLNGNYYNVNSMNTKQYNVSLDSMGMPISYDYAYVQNYDSVIAYGQVNTQYLELELPLYYRHNLGKHFALMGAVTISLGKTLTWSNYTQTISGLNLYDTVLQSADSVAPIPSKLFDHLGSTSFKNYKPMDDNALNIVRMGYSFGCAYVINNYLTLDVLLLQSLSSFNRIEDCQLRKLYTQPYFRISLGYTLRGH